MDPVCILVAGALRATLPADEFTLGWVHSVQRSRWEERYRVAPRGLTLVAARVQGSGAGMEPAPEARLSHGWWTWQPMTFVPELRLTESRYTADYTLCWNDRCAPLAELAGTADGPVVVTLRPCGAGDAAPNPR